MTLREVSRQLFELSVSGYFNRKKLTEKQLRNHIAAQTQGDGQKTVVMEIALPDGWWYFEVEKLPQFGKGYYEYHIPVTREQEKIMVTSKNSCLKAKISSI